MDKKFIFLSIFSIVFTTAAYVSNFYSDSISRDPGAWGQVGDYFGGVLNPILSFISIILIVRSLNFQAESNLFIKEELEHSRRSEELRSFENKFFNMIKVQASKFNNFECELMGVKFLGTSAVIAIEDEIKRLQESGENEQELVKFVRKCDEKEQIFGVARAFYMCTKYVMDHLSDARGFKKENRIEYINTLINFTDFSLLRLNMISIKFLDFESGRYLRSCVDFEDAIKDLGLSFNLY